MKMAKFQYKCRLCGEIYDGPCGQIKNAHMILIHTILDEKIPEFLGAPPMMISTHLCKNGHGVSDLVGYIEEEVL